MMQYQTGKSGSITFAKHLKKNKNQPTKQIKKNNNNNNSIIDASTEYNDVFETLRKIIVGRSEKEECERSAYPEYHSTGQI